MRVTNYPILLGFLLTLSNNLSAFSGYQPEDAVLKHSFWCIKDRDSTATSYGVMSCPMYNHLPGAADWWRDVFDNLKSYTSDIIRTGIQVVNEIRQNDLEPEGIDNSMALVVIGNTHENEGENNSMALIHIPCIEESNTNNEVLLLGDGGSSSNAYALVVIELGSSEPEASVIIMLSDGSEYTELELEDSYKAPLLLGDGRSNYEEIFEVQPEVISVALPALEDITTNFKPDTSYIVYVMPILFDFARHAKSFL